MWQRSCSVYDTGSFKGGALWAIAPPQLMEKEKYNGKKLKKRCCSMLWQKHWSALLHGTIRIQVPNLQLCWYLFWDFNSWYVCSSWPTYHVFAVTLPSANRLQSKQVDITSAYSHTAKVIETMKAQKSAAKDGVRKVFLAAKMDIDIRLRTVGRQTRRENITAGSTYELFSANNLHHSILGKYRFWPIRPIWWSPEENDDVNHTFVKFNFFGTINVYDILKSFLQICQMKIAWQLQKNV